MKKSLFLLIPFVLLFVTVLHAQSKTTVADSTRHEYYRNSIDFSPISPLIKIYGLHFNHKFTSKDEYILGVGYMNIHYDFGNTNSPSLIFGYRRYLWRNLHIEYQLWPCYDEFWEKNERKIYKSFDVWNEFRLGYQFNFKIAQQPFYTSIQWPFGFGLYASNKPKSFKDHEKENRFFYQFPLLFLGVRF
ncbi:MAG: hypothetical protein HXX13_09620 [Bacteroidetes bacterium]|nr:hypothetical protein [Bacteroidota bacterium]